MTPAQNATLKAYIEANQDLNGQPTDGNGLEYIANHLNALAIPAFPVWKTAVPVLDIFNAVDRSKYTPTDAADSTVLYTNRCLAAQTKMMALDGMLTGRETLDASRTTIRLSLRDAVIALPTGVSGASASAGGASGATVLNACTRSATVAEKILAGANETTGTVTAAILTFQGNITNNEVDTARRS